MIAIQSGRLAAPVQTPARPALSAPPNYLRRMARFIVLRAALRGRLGWPAALLVLARLEVLS
ncbi:hypothetical protein [Roseateles sp.]|uniref:hypothetical protein n=1 Tax=Roseateles sp. TaxID=1971397 RepID=UPI00395312CD